MRVAADAPVAGGRRRGLGTYASSALALLVVFAVVSSLIGYLSFRGLLHARRDLLERFDPAETARDDYVKAMLDQETGVRGFALDGDEDLLQPYTSGVAAQDDARRRLQAFANREQDAAGQDAAGQGAAGQVAAMDRAAGAWRDQWEDPIIASVRAGRSPSSEEVAAGKDLFDAFRASADRVGEVISADRDEAAVRLDHETNDLALVLLAAVAGLLAYAAIVWRATRRLVVGPVARLRDDALQVAGGDLDHVVTPSGPVELTDVGAAVDEMRLRIVHDLAEVESARAELDTRALELSRSNRDLEQFAYVASHDLQEPLRKVASFCQLLQQRYGGQLDDRADQYIGFAVDGAKRMQVLINDLLAFSRVGRTTEAFEPVDLDAVVDRTVGDLEASLADADAIVSHGPLPTVEGDRTLLAALFLNLISNGVKFRADSPPRIRITAMPVDPAPTASDATVAADPVAADPVAADAVAADAEEGPVEWELAVADNGIGIEPRFADRVFAIFARLHGRDEYPGTGIGLALCKKIVEFHGGTIWVDQDVESGTTIRFTLPTQPPARLPAAALRSIEP